LEHVLQTVKQSNDRWCMMFMFVVDVCRILSSLKHPHIVTFHESFFDADERVLCIIQVLTIAFSPSRLSLLCD